MGIKKVVFKGLSSPSFTWTAIGGIRFYDMDNNIINSGNVISNESQNGETSVFSVTSTVGYMTNGDKLFYILNAFDSTKTEAPTSSLNKDYFAVNSENVNIECIFKNEVDLSKISFNVTPDSSASDRGVESPFVIEIHDSTKLIKKFNITPLTGARNIIQSQGTILNKTLIQLSSGEYKRFVNYSDISKYSFDNDVGNIIVDKNGLNNGTATGTTMVEGYNGQGFARNFNGTSDYVIFNSNPLIPVGKKSIRFKIRIPSTPSSVGYVFCNMNAMASQHGVGIFINPNGTLQVNGYHANASSVRFAVISPSSVCDNSWHDVLFIWDGTTDSNAIKLYIDDMTTPVATGTSTSVETVYSTVGATFGKLAGTTLTNYLKFDLDEFEIYGEIINPLEDDETWQTIPTSTPTKSDFDTYGMDDLSIITESAWQELASTSPNVNLVSYVPDGNTVGFTESYDDNGRTVKLGALPFGQVIIPNESIKTFGAINHLVMNEATLVGVDKGIVRVLLSFDNGVNYKSFNGTSWFNVNTSDKQDVISNGMTSAQLLAIPKAQYTTLMNAKGLKIAYYLEEHLKKDQVAEIENVKANQNVPSETSEVSNMKLTIVNTIAEANLTFGGNRLNGTISDDDNHKVQFRVLLNGAPHYPTDASFTPLQKQPVNMSIKIPTSELRIGQQNVLRVEFRDELGAFNYWEQTFTGAYAGLMFSDPSGTFYSDEIGTILSYLDFGMIIAGQTSVEHEVVLTNTYGYDIKNLKITAENTNIGEGVALELSKSSAPFVGSEELTFANPITNGDSVSFYVRLTTQITALPKPEGKLEIRADAVRV